MAHRLLHQIRFRFVLFALLCSTPAVFLFARTVAVRREARLDRSRERALQGARQLAQARRSRLGAVAVALRSIDALCRGRGTSPTTRDLEATLRAAPQLAELGFASSDGVVLATAYGPPGGSLAEKPWFRKALETRQFAVGDVVTSQGSAARRVALPLADASGRIDGVLFAAVRAEWLAGRNEGGVSAADGAWLLDGDFCVLAADAAGAQSPGQPLPVTPLLSGARGDECWVETPAPDGATWVYGSVAIPDAEEWACARVIRAGDPRSQLLHPVNLALLAGVLSFSAFSAWLFGAFVLRGIRSLVTSCRRLAAGMLDTRLDHWHGKGELDVLAEAFNEMALAMQEREQHVKGAEARYRALVEESPGVLYVARTGRGADRTYVSPQIEALAGYPARDWTDQPFFWAMRIHPTDRERVLSEMSAALASAGDFTIEYRIVAKNGGPVWIRDRGKVLRDKRGRPSAVRGFLIDISDRKHLEEAFVQAQKMEAVGRLAGGIAHDFNNLLVVINGYAEMLLDSEIAAGDPKAWHAEILAAGRRAAALTRQLLAFSRRQTIQPAIHDLGDLVAGTEKMLRRLIGEDVELEVRRTPEPCRVSADAGQMEQILVNLAVNARDAMPQGGHLTVELGHSDAPHELLAGLKPGRLVTLTVSDTGHGMDEQTRARIFEPFFTTKPVGKGTGLGLATVYGIVRQSGGHITVESEPGSGARFRIWLPECADAAETEAGAAGEKAPRGTERVLVVEDETPVRRYVARVLTEHGYETLEARDGLHAREILEDEGEFVNLVLSDWVMPRMTGPELARWTRAHRPGIRFLFVSGYTDLAERPDLREGEVLLDKPFTAEQLLRAVRGALDRVILSEPSSGEAVPERSPTR